MADFTSVYINGDMEKLAAIFQTLETNGIVSRVEYTPPVSGTHRGLITCYDSSDNEIFSFKYENQWVTYTIVGTTRAGKTMSSTGVTGTAITGYKVYYGYACGNGILVSIAAIISSNNLIASMWLLVTKNQDGEPIFVWVNQNAASSSSSIVATNMNTEYTIAPDDAAPLGNVPRLAPAVRNQAVLSPFFSTCAAGDVSFSPDAGRFLACDFSGFIADLTAHEVSFEGATWLTNGYWALKVG